MSGTETEQQLRELSGLLEPVGQSRELSLEVGGARIEIANTRSKVIGSNNLAAGQRASGLFSNIGAVTFYSMYLGHKYVLTVQGNTVDEAAEEALHFAYHFLGRALQEHRSQGRNGEYETFAVAVLALLQKYRHLYSNPPEAPEP